MLLTLPSSTSSACSTSAGSWPALMILLVIIQLTAIVVLTLAIDLPWQLWAATGNRTVNGSDLPFRTVSHHHIFSLGGRRTGVGFHSHDENWLLQLYGAKAWFITPPRTPSPKVPLGYTAPDPAAASFSPPSPPLPPPPNPPPPPPDALRCTEIKVDHPCDLVSPTDDIVLPDSFKRCLVSPGSAIYIPTGWKHATCNLGQYTLAVGGQGDLGRGMSPLQVAAAPPSPSPLSRPATVSAASIIIRDCSAGCSTRWGWPEAGRPVGGRRPWKY